MLSFLLNAKDFSEESEDEDVADVDLEDDRRVRKAIMEST